MCNIEVQATVDAMGFGTLTIDDWLTMVGERWWHNPKNFTLGFSDFVLILHFNYVFLYFANFYQFQPSYCLLILGWSTYIELKVWVLLIILILNYQGTLILKQAKNWAAPAIVHSYAECCISTRVIVFVVLMLYVINNCMKYKIWIINNLEFKHVIFTYLLTQVY